MLHYPNYKKNIANCNIDIFLFPTIRKIKNLTKIGGKRCLFAMFLSLQVTEWSVWRHRGHSLFCLTLHAHIMCKMYAIYKDILVHRDTGRV